MGLGLDHNDGVVWWMRGVSVVVFVVVIVVTVVVVMVVVVAMVVVVVTVMIVVVMAVVIMAMFMFMTMTSLLVRTGWMGRLDIHLRRRRAAAALRVIALSSRLHLRWVSVLMPMALPMSVSQQTGPPGIRRRSLIGRVVVMHIVMAI